MKKKNLIIALIFLKVININAQSINNTWRNVMGGSGYEATYSLADDASMDTKTVSAIDNEGNVIVATNSLSNDGLITNYKGGKDVIISKYTSSGDIVWTVSFGGTKNETPRDIIALDSGDFLIAGYTNSNTGDLTGHHGGSSDDREDGFLARFNKNGEVKWTKQYGGNNMFGLDGYDYFFECDLNNVGNIVVVGRSYSQNGDLEPNWNTGAKTFTTGWLVEVNPVDGSIVQNFRIKSYNHDEGHKNCVKSFVQLEDSSYVLVGYTGYGLSGNVHWATRVKNNGEVIWEQEIGNIKSIFVYQANIVKSYDNNVMISLSTGDSTVTGFSGGWSDCWLLKLNADNGTIMDQKCFGGISTDYPFKLLPDGYGKYYMIGCAGPDSTNENYVHGGNISYDNYLIYLTESFDTLWTYRFGGNDDDRGTDIDIDISGDLYISGFTESSDEFYDGNYGQRDAWIGRFKNNLTGISKNENQFKINIYPNPANEVVYIDLKHIENLEKVELVDVLGKKYEINSGQSKYQLSLNLNHLNDGVYLIQITTHEQVYLKKIMVKH